MLLPTKHHIASLKTDFALIHKERRLKKPLVQSDDEESANSLPILFGPGEGTEMMLVGDVKGKTCILVDDIADTAVTLTRAADFLAQVGGATKIYAFVSHAILSENAVDRLKNSHLDQVIVSDSVPQEEHVKQSGGLIKVMDVAPLFSEAIRRIHNGKSHSFY